MAVGSLAARSHILHSGASGSRVLAVMRAYFDASRCDSPRITAIGGYVGSDEDWARVERDWVAALEYWKLPYFHLTELPTIMGHEKAKLCAANFSSIIKSSNLWAISAGVLEEDYEAFYDRQGRVGYTSIYHLALELSVELLGEYMSFMRPEDQVALIIDNDYNPPDAAYAIFDYFKRARASDDRLLSLTIGSMKDFTALQCADLVAGLWRRHWSEKGKIAEGETAELVAYVNSFAEQSMSCFWSLENLHEHGRLALRSMSARIRSGSNIAQ